MRINTVPFFITTVALVGLWPTIASADCDRECGPGLICEVVEEPTCYAARCVQDDGSACDPYCETQSVERCVPMECTDDAECGEGNVCLTYSTGPCPDVAPRDCSEDDTNCEVPACEETDYQQCAPRHEAPCSEDADCGEGFECVVASCQCPAAVDPDDGEAPECDCEPSTEGHCRALDIECETVDDCPSGWSCEDEPTTCWADSDGNSGCEEGEKLCQVPGFGDAGGNLRSEQDGSLNTEPTGAESSSSARKNSANDEVLTTNSGCSFGVGAVGGANTALLLLALGASTLLRRRRKDPTEK